MYSKGDPGKDGGWPLVPPHAGCGPLRNEGQASPSPSFQETQSLNSPLSAFHELLAFSSFLSGPN